MIGEADYAVYCKAADAIAEEGAKRATATITAWIEANPGASAEQIRSQTLSYVKSLSSVYGDAMASLAAEWYDETVVAEHSRLAAAVTAAVCDEESAAETVRYQMAKCLEGGPAAFANACGEYVANSSRKSLNNTVLQNAARDAGEGVRFARVTSGLTTCDFCTMLAGRGAVYYTRSTAGEMNRWHRGCRCKVVAGTAADPMTTLVEGHDPQEYAALWRRYMEVNRLGMPKAQSSAIKAAWADSIVKTSEKMSAAALADVFEAGARSARLAFFSSKTLEGYSRTIGAYLEALGDAYGLDMSGETVRLRSGDYAGAHPNGNEIYAAVSAADSGSVRFICERADKTPDVEINGVTYEIKTPESRRKVSVRLKEALVKSDNAILDTSRMAEDSAYAAIRARSFAEDSGFGESFDSVIVLYPDRTSEVLGKQ